MKKLILFGFLILSGLNIAAQNGTVRGKVTSAETGEELIGASVVIAGTTIGTSVDIDGNYSIANVTPGNYRLTVKYISFQSDTTDITVKKGDVTLVNFALRSSAIAIKAFTVEAKAARSSENAMLAMQKKSATVMDGISAQQISKSGDSDAASAIKRVTGISVEGGKYVYVRGLSDRYSKTTLNGAEIPGLDPNRNSVQMDLFPSNLVDNITILKTFSPDLPGSFTGGLLNIETKDFPEKFTIQFSSSLGYNTQSNLNNNFLTYNGSGTDWVGFDNSTRAIPNAALHQVPELFKDNKKLTEVTKSFNKDFEASNEKSLLNQSYSFSTGNQKNLFGKPLGFIVGLTYSKEYDFYDNGTTGRYSLTGNVDEVTSLNTELLLEDTKGSENTLWGAMLNIAYKISPHHKIGIHALRNQNGISLARAQEGIIPRDAIGMHYQTRTLQYLERSLTSTQIKGEHFFEKLKDMKINWLGSYTLSTQEEPDLRFFTNDYILSENGLENVDTLYRIQPALYPVPSRFYRDMEETNIDTKINFEVPLNKGSSASRSKLKWGASAVVKDRSFHENRYDYKSQGGIKYNGNIADYMNDDNMNIGSSEGYLYIVNASEKRNSYTGSETVMASYLMADLFLNARLRMIAGARMEKTDISVISANPELPPGVLNNLDILPALNTSFSLTEKMNLRGAYSRTLARPNFRELAPFGSFDFVGDYFLVGNNNLQRTLIDNVDLRWEMFPQPGEIFSLSGFYKHFTNPIERAYNPIAANPEINYRNVDQAILYGAEVEFRKSISFISKALENFHTGINFTYVYSKVQIDSLELISIKANDPKHSNTREMFGQSPYIINSFLNYTNDSLKFSANISYNISGPQLSVVVIGGAPNVYEQPRGQLDFNLTKQLRNNFSVKFSARNLLNPEFKQTQTYKDEEYVFQSYRVGRTFSVGVNYLIK